MTRAEKKILAEFLMHLAASLGSAGEALMKLCAEADENDRAEEAARALQQQQETRPARPMTFGEKEPNHGKH